MATTVTDDRCHAIPAENFHIFQRHAKDAGPRTERVRRKGLEFSLEHGRLICTIVGRIDDCLVLRMEHRQGSAWGDEWDLGTVVGKLVMLAEELGSYRPGPGVEIDPVDPASLRSRQTSPCEA